MPSVYIIIVSYNSKEVLRRCLQSLRKLHYSTYRIVVVDNASIDGTVDAVRPEFPELPLIQTGGNLGYTGGNNRGMEYALSEGADYVLLLNPDTVLYNSNFLKEMIGYMEAHGETGICGPRVFLREGGVVQNTVLFPPGLWRNIVHWIRYRMNPAFGHLSADKIVDAEVLNGVCLLVRADCLHDIGLFDENIFMYIEDVDMQHRATQKGWKIRYLPIDSVVHEQKREGYHMTSFVSFLLKRNTVYYLVKIGKRFDAVGYALLSLVIMFGRALSPFKSESTGEYLAFCKRLVAAYKQILLDRPLGKSFGPPYA